MDKGAATDTNSETEEKKTRAGSCSVNNLSIFKWRATRHMGCTSSLVFDDPNISQSSCAPAGTERGENGKGWVEKVLL